MILNEVVSFSLPIKELSIKLKELNWDYSSEPLEIKALHVIDIMNKYIQGIYNSGEIEQWANLIECREDLGYYPDQKDVLGNII
jgi:hypothetical protein